MYRDLLIEKFNPDYTNNLGSAYWYNKKGERHRSGDNPAVILSRGSMKWYKNGKLHRDGDKPAVIYANGEKEWYVNGMVCKWKTC